MKIFSKSHILISLFNQSSTVTLLYKFSLCAGGRVSLLWYEWWIISKMNVADSAMLRSFWKKVKGCIFVNKTQIWTWYVLIFSTFLNKISFFNWKHRNKDDIFSTMKIQKSGEGRGVVDHRDPRAMCPTRVSVIKREHFLKPPRLSRS